MEEVVFVWMMVDVLWSCIFTMLVIGHVYQLHAEVKELRRDGKRQLERTLVELRRLAWQEIARQEAQRRR